MEETVAKLKAQLCAQAGCTPEDVRIVRAPLRICPLGAHVDHQDGRVTGMTLDRAIYLAFIPRPDGHVRVTSLNYPGTISFSLDAIPPRVKKDWGNYVRGAAQALQCEHAIQVGIDAVVMGTMPVGGLSSSAAVGIAYLLALEVVNELELSSQENIQLDRYIENVYLGVKNGLLDQSMILLSEHAHLTYLDCSTLFTEKIPTPAPPESFEILVVYSGVRQTLAGTDYNNRVRECQEAARQLLTWAHLPVPETPLLRMVPDEVYEELGERLPDRLAKRARHFFTENRRVLAGVAAWRDGDMTRLGELVTASGASSLYNYEAGCPQLSTLYEILRAAPGVYGARFSGGGFRGSCIALSHPDYRAEIVETIATHYPTRHPEVADLYSVHFCHTDGPARLENGHLP